MEDALATTDAAPAALVPLAGRGAVVAGRYRLEEPLGAGGAGAVWRARDLQLDGVVALKLLAMSEGSGELERWRREVAMARRIAHRNVCRVHDLGEHGGTRFVTMELIEGKDLRALASRIEPARALDLLHQIVAGAAAIHAAGIVHRDLKPENVVVDDGGRVVIVDFGLAREPTAATAPDRDGGAAAAADVTNRSAIAGTPAYMSPEQAAGHAVDARTDVWALGLIAYELLLGQLPSRPAADEATPTRGAARDAPALHHGPSIATAIERRAPGLGAIVARCLATDPDDRYPDAIALAAALAAPRRPRRRRAILAVAAAIVVTGAAATAAIVVAGRAGADRPRATRADGPITQTRITDAPTDAKPLSSTLSPDGKRLAYTVHGKLLVRALDGGDPVEWKGPPITTAFAIGFFPDGAVAITGTKVDGTWAAWRVAPGHDPVLLYQDQQRIEAALSPDGKRLAVGLGERGISLIDTDGSRNSHRVVSAARGEEIAGVTWSPDGHAIAFARTATDQGDDAIEIANVDDGATHIVKRGPFGHRLDQLLAWPEPDRLLYTVDDSTASSLRELELATGVDRERARWPGEYVGTGSYAGGHLVVSRGTVRYSIWTAKLDAAAGAYGWERVHPADVTSGRLAGWTDDGRIVYMERSHDDLTIVTQAPGHPRQPLPGAPTGVRPETLVGDALIVRRTAGAQVTVARVALAGGPVTDLDAVPADSVGTSLVRCAGDRAPPCVLEEVQGNRVTWTEIDPVTGAAGALVYEAPVSGRFQRSAALSPDGMILAVVDGTDTLTLVERGGSTRTIAVGRGAELESVAFAHDGRSVLVTGIGHKGYLFNLIRVGIDGTIDDVEREWDKWYWRALENRDGTRLAVTANEFALDLWRIDGL